MTTDTQGRGFPAKNVRDGVYGGVCVGYAFAFTLSNGQLVEVDLLNFEAVFSKRDELQEWGVVLLVVGVGSADPSLNVFGSGRPCQDPEGWSVE